MNRHRRWTKKNLSILIIISLILYSLQQTSTGSTHRTLEIESNAEDVETVIKCVSAITDSDAQPRDAQLTKSEYVDFLNFLSQDDYQDFDFEELPLDLKTNYEKFEEGGVAISFFGETPGEAFPASDDQKQFLRDFCLGTSKLLDNAGTNESIPVPNMKPTNSLLATNCADDGGNCENPFVGGCLRQKLGSDIIPRRRACNSQDSQEIIDQGLCEVSPFDYMEIRITPGNWESANFYSWVIQIILSELLFVPVSIDTGKGDPLNFYDVKNGFGYNSVSHNYEALVNSNQFGDCRNAPDDRACAHVFPEFWRAYQNSSLINYDEVEEVINSMVGYLAWYVPKHLVEADMTLMSYWGYFGEKNRKKLAKLFKRPTTWGDYCALESKTNCSVKDEFASGQPETGEEKLYFFENDTEKYYTGFFRATERNNCTLNADCMGHFVEYPCSWGAFTDQIIHWNNVSLEHEVEYEYGELQQIFKAANATNSAIIATWFYPDSGLEQYDYWRVSLPEATLECQRNRFVPQTNRCEKNRTELRGNKFGSCGYQSQSLSTLIANSVRKDSLEAIEAMQSPAYETLRKIRVHDLDISNMLETWAKDPSSESSGYKAREAVCSWLEAKYTTEDKAENIKRFIPNTYPREFPATWQLKWYNYAAMSVGAMSLLVVLLTTAAVQCYRKERVIQRAQPEFLNIFSLGYFMVCTAAILISTIMPTDASCIASQWLISLGYTQGMVPLLLKVSVINRLMQNARKMKKVKISKKNLYGYVIACTLIISAYLLAWTLIDPQSQSKELTVTSEEDAEGNEKNIVVTDFSCSSFSPVWLTLALTWEALFMLAAAVLSFQSRNFQSDVNESRELGRMAYVHLLFFLARGLIALLQPPETHIIISFFLSLDSLLSIALYTGPKILAARKQKNSPLGSSDTTSHGHRQSIVPGSVPGCVISFGENNNNIERYCPKCTSAYYTHQNDQSQVSYIKPLTRKRSISF